MEKVKYIIFDFDKTIATMDIDWSGWHSGVGEIFRKYQPPFDLDLKGMPIHHLQNEMYEKFGVELKKEVDAFVREFELENTKQILPIQKTLDFIDKQYNERKELAVWSSNDSATLEKYLTELNIINKFKIIISRDMVDFVKPDKSGFVKYFQPLSTNLEEFLFVGDSSFDKDAASNCGIDYIDVSQL